MPEHSTIMPSIADVVDHIQRAGIPTLFLDTCVRLDVIRAPLRPTQLSRCVEAAQELLQLSTSSPARCALVIGSFVRREWLTHAGSAADDLRGHLARMDVEAQIVHAFCGLVGIAPPFAHPDYGGLPLADRLHDLSRRLLDVALPLDPDRD